MYISFSVCIVCAIVFPPCTGREYWSDSNNEETDRGSASTLLVVSVSMCSTRAALRANDFLRHVERYPLLTSHHRVFTRF